MIIYEQPCGWRWRSLVGRAPG